VDGTPGTGECPRDHITANEREGKTNVVVYPQLCLPETAFGTRYNVGSRNRDEIGDETVVIHVLGKGFKSREQKDQEE
jgi:hypothetical protein